MRNLRSIKPAEPPLSLAEAKRILAQAVMTLDSDEKRNHPEYEDSVRNIRSVACRYLREGRGRRDTTKQAIQEEDRDTVVGLRKSHEGNEGKGGESSRGRRVRKRAADKEKEDPPGVEEVTEIRVQEQEAPGPCPCSNCKNNSHIPGFV